MTSPSFCSRMTRRSPLGSWRKLFGAAPCDPFVRPPLYSFPPGADSGIRCGFPVALDSVLATFTGTDADHVLDRGDEDLAVADTTGAGGRDDRLHRTLNNGVVAHHLDLHLGE